MEVRLRPRRRRKKAWRCVTTARIAISSKQPRTALQRCTAAGPPANSPSRACLCMTRPDTPRRGSHCRFCSCGWRIRTLQLSASQRHRPPTSSRSIWCVLIGMGHVFPVELTSLSLFQSPPFGDTFFTDAEAPTVDGVELLADLQEVVRDSVPAGTELLGGANLDEGTEFLSSCPPISCNASVADFTKWSIELFGEDLGPKVPALYTNPEKVW